MSDLQAAFLMAIQNEIKSQNLYRALARSFKANPDISSMLLSLVPLEKVHEQKLRTALTTEFPGEIITVDHNLQHNITEVELTDPEQVLIFAVEREMISAEIYAKLARENPEPTLHSLFLQLSGEEENHRNVLETEIMRMDGLMTWFDPSELNGLVEEA